LKKKKEEDCLEGRLKGTTRRERGKLIGVWFGGKGGMGVFNALRRSSKVGWATRKHSGEKQRIWKKIKAIHHQPTNILHSY